MNVKVIKGLVAVVALTGLFTKRNEIVKGMKKVVTRTQMGVVNTAINKQKKIDSK